MCVVVLQLVLLPCLFVLFVCLFVWFVCRQDISIRIAPIFMKVCGRVGHRPRTNPLILVEFG